MASFQVKIPAKGQEREKKKIALMGSNPTRNREFQKNSKKKIKTLENTIISSFQAKIGLERLRKRENFKKKTFQGISTRPVIENSKKIAKKSKNQKTPLWLLFKPKQNGKGREREKIKVIIPISSYPARNRKFQKIAKKFKNQ